MTERKKKNFSALDAFIVLGVVLLILGMVGQNVAVYLIDSEHSKEEFELSFVVKTYENADAQTLLKAQNDAGEEGLTCYYKEQAVCSVKSLHVEPLVGQSGDGGAATLCRVTGILSAKGYVKGGVTYLFGYGEIAEEDILVLSVEGRTVSFELTKVNVKKVENNT